MFKYSNVKMKRGFTLIEMMVAVTIFALVIGSATGLFISAVRSQVKALAAHKLLDESSYVIEYMSRFLRMAQSTGGSCTSGGLNYENPGGDASRILFSNYYGSCQEFYLDGGGLLKQDLDFLFWGELTSANLEVTSLQFNLSGEALIETGDYLQPRVTISMTIKKRDATGPEIKIQTTVSQRNLDVSSTGG